MRALPMNGIGAVLAPEAGNGLIIQRPLPGHPAERAGIQAGDKIVAIDDSEEMLALARTKWKGTSKIKFQNCSLENFSAGKGNFDLVVLNMVMHHMPSPAKAFQKLEKIVADGGYLLIADLGLHNQEWARESCGDVWLGFDPQDLNEWGKDAGFVEEQSSYLGLKNGFQIQLKLFQKEKING